MTCAMIFMHQMKSRIVETRSDTSPNSPAKLAGVARSAEGVCCIYARVLLFIPQMDIYFLLYNNTPYLEVSMVLS